MATLQRYQTWFCSQNTRREFVFSCFIDTYIFPIQINFTLVLPLKRIKMRIAAVNWMKWYQLSLSYLEQSNITFWFRANFCLHLNNTEKDSLLQPYWAMSSSHINSPIHLTVKLSQNNFYHYESLCQLENMPKNVIAIISYNLVS